MATQNNDVLGYVICEAGGRASVHQTKRGRGRYLYTRCDCCGCDQRNGAAFQTRIFNTAEWLGEAPATPPNFIAAAPVVQPKQPSNDAGLGDPIEPDFNPEEEPKQPNAEPKGSVVFLSIAGLLLGSLALAIGRAA